MRSKAEAFYWHAEACRHRAAAMSDRKLRALYLDLSSQWIELAETIHSLEAARKTAEECWAIVEECRGASREGGGRLHAATRTPPVLRDRFPGEESEFGS
jgi:hypothetical protein